ncbi:MAG: hypothetical protein ACRD5I_08780, partial [Candidatus Acidiferrales bacterium]
RELVRFYRYRSRVVGALGTPLVFWLLLEFVCLTLATVFGFCALWVAWDAGLLEPLKRRVVGAANPGKEKAKPAAPGEKAE